MRMWLGAVIMVVWSGTAVSALEPAQPARQAAVEVRQSRTPQKRIIKTAKDFAAGKGFRLAKYPMIKAEFHPDEGKWWVHFSQKSPAPPGGHFSVTVDDRTGKAIKLYRGE